MILEHPMLVEWAVSAVGLAVAFTLGMLFERQRARRGARDNGA